MEPWKIVIVHVIDDYDYIRVDGFVEDAEGDYVPFSATSGAEIVLSLADWTYVLADRSFIDSLAAIDDWLEEIDTYENTMTPAWLAERMEQFEGVTYAVIEETEAS